MSHPGVVGLSRAEMIEATKKLATVAGSAAYLVRERVIARENYMKCLMTWIDKNAKADPFLKRIAREELVYEKVVVTMPEY